MCKYFILILTLHVSIMATAGGSTSVGPGSPASYRCLELGGNDLTFDEDKWGGNQIGVCAFAEVGAVSLIEEWSLRKTSLAAKAFLGNEFGQGTGPLEQRAKDYCLEIGGKVRKYVDDLKATVYYDLCEFNDRSSIEIWTLYWGTQYSPKLAHILK